MKNPSDDRPIVYLHSSEDMSEIPDLSVSLLVGASIYLGKKASWSDYAQIYDQVYNFEGLRILREDGVLLVLQTDAYQNGKFVPRLRNLMDMLLADEQAPASWELLDRKIWIRQKASLFQVPFSDVLLLRPNRGSASRSKFNTGNKAWFQGVWNFSPSGEADNAYPAAMCELIIQSLTKKGDLIVDPFCGSGKMGGLAHALGRRYVGYEIDSRLIPTIQGNGCDVIVKGQTLQREKTGLVY